MHTLRGIEQNGGTCDFCASHDPQALKEHMKLSDIVFHHKQTQTSGSTDIGQTRDRIADLFVAMHKEGVSAVSVSADGMVSIHVDKTVHEDILMVITVTPG